MAFKIGALKRVLLHLIELTKRSRPAPAPRCPPASQNFVGRIEELNQMFAFFYGSEGHVDQLRIFLLIGM